MGIDALLYEHDGESAAEVFWREYPPERIHTWALDFENGSDWVSQNLRPLAWSPDVPELGNAELVCLAHAGTNPEAPCFGFFFWVQFCQWTLEVQVSTDGVSVESEIVRAVAESAISGTMADVGC